ncbi:hypothetical protein ACRSLK_07235 [Halopseudomonas pachastrellae]|uniref:hypothetical protein n=1 Tax=Halopseudomonas pachastrellae TaxID=254161 RepID=UPI003D7E03AD
MPKRLLMAAVALQVAELAPAPALVQRALERVLAQVLERAQVLAQPPEASAASLV